MAQLPESKEQKIRQKDPVDLVIMLGGIVVGILILTGFVVTLIPFLNPDLSKPRSVQGTSTPITTGVTLTSDTSNVACEHCLTVENNNNRITVSHPTDISLELPQAQYPRANLLLFGNPSGTLILVGDTQPHSSGNWAVTLRTVEQGVGDVIVQSKDPSVSDFHVSFTIQ